MDDLEINIDDLFNSQVEDEEIPEDKHEQDNTMTKAVSERINTVRKQTETDTQEKIAKELGFDSYEDLKKAKEQKMFEDAGIDADDERQKALVDKLVDERLAADPRIKKVEEFEKAEKARFVSSQLKEIEGMTGEKYTSVDDLPKEVLDMWGKIGNLKQAFLAVKGEEILARPAKNVSSFTHLGDMGSGSLGTKARALTEEEKRLYRMVNPDITEEELSKKTIEQ